MSHDLPDSGKEPFTDYSRWRLLVNDGGRQTWHYMKTDEQLANWPQNDIDRYWLGIGINMPALPAPETPIEAARNGYTFYKHLQSHDGHWAGEYGGPLFLLPGLVMSSYVTGMPFKQEERLEMMRYLMNYQREDGGWGLHIEGVSTAFGSTMNYITMRLLGAPAEHPVCVKARGCLHKLGGAAAVPAWGKFWLSVLNVYDWDGNNPIIPELWILPDWVPFHPHRWWIHVRTLYAPMSYLYGVRFQMPENDLLLALREEIYTENFYQIDWPAQRNNVCKIDIYYPHTALFDGLNSVLGVYEMCAFPPLRRAAIEKAYHLVVLEDENTAYQTLAPVSKAMNAVVRFHRDGTESESWKQHNIKRADFMWLGAKGMMVCGTNGSQLWDTAFISQALAETGIAKMPEHRESVLKALEWVDGAQMIENPKHHNTSYRHDTKGAWGFSTREQGYTVSDCTGEGLKAVLYLQGLDFTPKQVSDRRLYDAVDIIMSLQNPNGGFASYELIRGPAWLEMLNAAEVFGDIMIEICYPECTTSAITGLAIFRKHFPDYRSDDIERTIRGAVDYLHKAQKPEGGWIGCWGICFTYATMFATESLSLVGETYETSAYSKRACEYLLSKQREDGGWGESYLSCERSTWVEHENTQVVQTSWAAMALMYAKYPDLTPIKKAVALVMSRQLPDGSWAQEAIEGVFNKTCAISYPNFKFSFTIWMLGLADKYIKEHEA